ncbi:MAG: hypothetical protein AAFW75_28825, partial [Cyanobacteria bacterium J06636_16]
MEVTPSVTSLLINSKNMFSSLPQKFRNHGLSADARTILLIYKAMNRGLIKTLGDLYALLRGIVVKEPEDMGPFTKAYYEYFLNIEVNHGESLEDAIVRSDTNKKWRKDYEEEPDQDISPEELANSFL